jgi:hypothetical protein
MLNAMLELTLVGGSLGLSGESSADQSGEEEGRVDEELHCGCVDVWF